ncbi:DegV family protein [Romboutsia lituseburensis]|uniref:EDD domain protein, DegV family n=1 Tax=Romboutsia lituseburensis DSM 797 TaxID=1121325 RepID=A0A1G9RNC5_9FIRM|nr:DegV family protein [Romboutsia lituseburensis]CEH32779.1 DegV domain-containing protein CPE0026 [Romboutsia lituseburensis]SDM24768.1 EDD domain protein, DegV family [Romboutsia lituseburensis DSM 797]
MKKSIKIITDGSCDFPQEVIDRVNPGIVGINVAFGDESFIGGVEIDDETFYNKMRGCKELPKTSSPSPDRFLELYNCEEDEVLVFTLTSKLSSTYSNAVLAKNMYLEENPHKRIEVIDSQSGSIGVALMILKCNELIENGKTMDEILDAIEGFKQEIIFFGALDTLENAIKGGRINAVAGKLINALNFKVIIRIEDGLVKPIDKARGGSNSLKKALEYVKNHLTHVETRTVVIGHANCPEKAEKIKQIINEGSNFKEILISSIGPIMGTFTSEGAILVSVL